jgi:hypothetical protein
MAANDNENTEMRPVDWLEEIECAVDALVHHLGDDGSIKTLRMRDLIVAKVECALGLTGEVILGHYPE